MSEVAFSDPEGLEVSGRKHVSENPEIEIKTENRWDQKICLTSNLDSVCGVLQGSVGKADRKKEKTAKLPNTHWQQERAAWPTSLWSLALK